MKRFLNFVIALFRDARNREFLLYCLPALLVGLVLRVSLCVQMPMGIYHDDTPDFLCTADRLLNDHKWQLHEKKTFLVPIAYTIPFLLPLPALVSIPIFQHLLGLVLVLIIGLLCRLWFTHWKWFIVPLTCATAVNPFMLWYEHTLMAESWFVFCTAMVALAGTLYALKSSRRRFIFLCVALFLEAGARPEGKLLFGFGIFLVALLHARAWRTEWRRVAIIGVLGIVTHLMTGTAQASLLLYTSVAKMTPTNLRCAPGFDPYIASIRTDLQTRWKEQFAFPKVRDRRAVGLAVTQYLNDNPSIKNFKKKPTQSSFCLRIAMETCRRNILALPEHVYRKFRAVALESPAGDFGKEWLFDIQREGLLGNIPLVSHLGHGLTGRAISSAEDINAFVDTSYQEIHWFNSLSAGWLNTVNRLRFPDMKIPPVPGKSMGFDYYGVPLYFAAGALGVLAVMLHRGKLRMFHFAWGLTLLGFFFVIMLTANVRPRFRFVFEPFWAIYAAMLAEALFVGVKAVIRR